MDDDRADDDNNQIMNGGNWEIGGGLWLPVLFRFRCLNRGVASSAKHL